MSISWPGSGSAAISGSGLFNKKILVIVLDVEFFLYQRKKCTFSSLRYSKQKYDNTKTFEYILSYLFKIHISME